MSKYVYRMNFPQYRFYNYMVGDGEKRKKLISDLLAAEMILRGGDKKERSQALITLAIKKSHLADFTYSQEGDRKCCPKDLTGRDVKQFRRHLDHYLDMLFMTLSLQGQSEKKRWYADRKPISSIPPEQGSRRLQYDMERRKYYTEYDCVSKLLLINEQFYGGHGYYEMTGANRENLERLVADDARYTINIQGNSGGDYAYLVKRDEELCVKVLNHPRGSRKISMRNMVRRVDGMTAVFLSLLNHLREIELAKQRWRKYLEDHPRKSEYAGETIRSQRSVDRSSIGVFDMKQEEAAPDPIGAAYFLGRKNSGRGGFRRMGCEILPYARRGHYRKYRNRKTIYVEAAIVHEEKYRGIQSAHRMNQPRGKNRLE